MAGMSVFEMLSKEKGTLVKLDIENCEPLLNTTKGILLRLQENKRVK